MMKVYYMCITYDTIITVATVITAIGTLSLAFFAVWQIKSANKRVDDANAMVKDANILAEQSNNLSNRIFDYEVNSQKLKEIKHETNRVISLLLMDFIYSNMGNSTFNNEMLRNKIISDFRLSAIQFDMLLPALIRDGTLNETDSFCKSVWHKLRKIETILYDKDMDINTIITKLTGMGSEWKTDVLADANVFLIAVEGRLFGKKHIEERVKLFEKNFPISKGGSHERT